MVSTHRRSLGRRTPAHLARHRISPTSGASGTPGLGLTLRQHSAPGWRETAIGGLRRKLSAAGYWPASGWRDIVITGLRRAYRGIPSKSVARDVLARRVASIGRPTS